MTLNATILQASAESFVLRLRVTFPVDPCMRLQAIPWPSPAYESGLIIDQLEGQAGADVARAGWMDSKDSTGPAAATHGRQHGATGAVVSYFLPSPLPTKKKKGCHLSINAVASSLKFFCRLDCFEPCHSIVRTIAFASGRLLVNSMSTTSECWAAMSLFSSKFMPNKVCHYLTLQVFYYVDVIYSNYIV